MDKPHDWRAHALSQVLWLLDPRGSLAKRWLARVYIHPDTKLGPPDTQVRQAGRPVHHVDRCERLWLRIRTATLQGLTAGPVIHLPTDGRQCRRGVRHPAICGYGLRDRRADRHQGRVSRPDSHLRWPGACRGLGAIPAGRALGQQHDRGDHGGPDNGRYYRYVPHHLLEQQQRIIPSHNQIHDQVTGACSCRIRLVAGSQVRINQQWQGIHAARVRREREPVLLWHLPNILGVDSRRVECEHRQRRPLRSQAVGQRDVGMGGPHRRELRGARGTFSRRVRELVRGRNEGQRRT